jgi:hypothetical protein
VNKDIITGFNCAHKLGSNFKTMSERRNHTEIKKYFVLGNNNTTYENFGDATKIALTEKFTASNTYIQRESKN